MSDDARPAQPPVKPLRPRRRRLLRTPAEAKAWRRRMVGYALIAGSFVLLVNALIGENGYLETLRAQREYDALMKSVAELRLDNQRLRGEILDLRDNPDALEEAARRDLGLIRPGEKLIVIAEPEPATPPATPPARQR
jgi:cell division protein FtsB